MIQGKEVHSLGFLATFHVPILVTTGYGRAKDLDLEALNTYQRGLARGGAIYEKAKG